MKQQGWQEKKTKQCATRKPRANDCPEESEP